jgi:FkbM family methyltransferase
MSSADGAVSIRARPRWTRVLTAPVRPLVGPLVHAWQRYYDSSRGKRRVREMQRRDAEERDRLLREATPIVQDVHGFRFVLYRYDQPNLLELTRHPADVAEFKVIPRLLRPGDVAFDVGANVGLYTVLLSRLCGPSGRVWAFEPVPETHWRLRETLALNRCENVVSVRAAVCDRDGTAMMNLFEPEHSEWNSLGKPLMGPADAPKVPPHMSVDVTASTLDRFCEIEKIQRINFLKLDVEGFELAVFHGAERVLGDHRVDYVCFEISQLPLKGAGVRSREVFAALEAHGYSCYGLDKETGKFVGPVQDTTEDWANFFASRVDLTGR